MAISPPSDLVLDVIRAADPAQVAAAQEQLKTNRANFMANSLAEKGAGFSATVDILNRTTNAARIEATAEKTEVVGKPPRIYRDFEAVYLTNFVQSMLPDESEEVYGKGNAGEMWKSMMAEQLGSTLAESGGVGIAKQMYEEALQRVRGEESVNAATDETDRGLAMSWVTDLERRTLGAAADTDTKN
ncbi:rod-binding protein [Rhizobium rosettiformans]|uniref:rod-binding protein n=1 Tax=Rhizobium rosettiformans TaxID=1368430 RepID=UPI00285DF1F8|nr:rod-binding protein [Rhizobium rosettiformans]MDR7028601.1 Rod binding domain-containing protein [Rhizobium rosettiformans]MDR7064117.1 Rod binding domain-containing protein [Rhizobium rosettiformans]